MTATIAGPPPEGVYISSDLFTLLNTLKVLLATILLRLGRLQVLVGWPAVFNNQRRLRPSWRLHTRNMIRATDHHVIAAGHPMARPNTPEGLQKHGLSLRQVKEWREREHEAGRKSGLNDFYRAHGICVECGGHGRLVIGVRWCGAHGIQRSEEGPISGAKARPR